MTPPQDIIKFDPDGYIWVDAVLCGIGEVEDEI